MAAAKPVLHMALLAVLCCCGVAAAAADLPEIDEHGIATPSIKSLDLDALVAASPSMLQLQESDSSDFAHASSEASKSDQRGDLEKERAFVQWLKKNGVGGLDAIEIAQVGDPPHRGMVALRDIAPEEAFIRMPFKMLMLGECQQIEEKLGMVFHHDYPDSKPFHYSDGSPNLHRRLALWLLYERNLGADSFFAPYINMLPQEFSMLYEYDAAELGDLMGTAVYQEVIDRQARNKWEYNVLFPTVSKAFPKLLGRNITWADWHWAKTIVNSRCFGFSHAGLKDVGLVPFADLPNHENVPVSWQITENETSTFDMVTKKSWKKGEEVFINYGSHDNRHLLSIYGFSLPNNEIKIKTDCEDMTNQTAKDTCVVKALQDMGTTIRDDLQLLLNGQLSFKRANAIKLRLEERKALLGLDVAISAQ